MRRPPALARTAAVLVRHPLRASLEIGGPEFEKLAPYLRLREIEVFGALSARAVDLVQQKASNLGDGGTVRLHEQFAGFDRTNPSSGE